MMKNKIIVLLMMCLAVCQGVGAQQMNVCSFNIRYANGDRKDAERCWDARKDRVAQFVLQHNVSIVGMQEVLHEQLLDLRSRLGDYDYEGVGREDGKTKGEYAPIFWRKAEWERLKGGTFWLSATPDVVASVGWDAALTRIATYVLLQNRQSGSQLIFINTHFDHVGGQARNESAHLILSKAKEIAGDVPFVLTGDFNVSMESPAYHTITHDATFPILDTYMEGAPHEGPFHTFHGFNRTPIDQCYKIDYIFASPNIKVLNTYTYTEDRSEHPKHLSDHNPIISTVAL